MFGAMAVGVIFLPDKRLDLLVSGIMLLQQAASALQAASNNFPSSIAWLSRVVSTSVS